MKKKGGISESLSFQGFEGPLDTRDQAWKVLKDLGAEIAGQNRPQKDKCEFSQPMETNKKASYKQSSWFLGRLIRFMIQSSYS